MEFEQRSLRQIAAETLARQGFEVVESVKGAGGARLKVMKGDQPVLALVRTSSDRWVGWMRNADGELKGLEDAGIVVVAALDNPMKPSEVEVFAFDPQDVSEAFEANLAARKASGALSTTSPIFVCLDEVNRDKPGAVSSNLKAKAIWVETVKVGADVADDEVEDAADDKAFDEAQEDEGDDYGALDLEGLLEAFKAELADRLNLPVKCITLELRVQV